MNPRTAFEYLKPAIDAACVSQDSSSVFRLAEELGLGGQQTDTDRIMSLSFRYQLCENNMHVVLLFRSFDTSSPFVNLPDMNRFVLELYEGSVMVDCYQNEFLD